MAARRRQWREGAVPRPVEGARYRHPARPGDPNASAQDAPIDSIADFRRALAIARLPLPLRLLLVWLSLNIGRQVPNFMGSFAISALGSHGAAIVDTIPVWSSFLNYGPIAPDGGVDVYLSVDHRVIDGGPAARAIRALEATLNGPVLDELRALAGAS